MGVGYSSTEYEKEFPNSKNEQTPPETVVTENRSATSPEGIFDQVFPPEKTLESVTAEAKESAPSETTNVENPFGASRGAIFETKSPEPLKEIYVITGDTVLGYTSTLEEAKAFLEKNLAHRMIGYFLNRIKTVREDDEDPVRGTFISTVYELPNFYFLRSSRVAFQLIIWKTSPAEHPV
jgi:hypothetical protein